MASSAIKGNRLEFTLFSISPIRRYFDRRSSPYVFANKDGYAHHRLRTPAIGAQLKGSVAGTLVGMQRGEKSEGGLELTITERTTGSKSKSSMFFVGSGSVVDFYLRNARFANWQSK